MFLVDLSYKAWQEDGEWKWLKQSHGLIDEQALLLLFKKKFIRCPEQYFITALMLSAYLMVATCMVLNLLVALFATTYEDVQVLFSTNSTETC